VINNHALEDLDALHFFDKIEMRSASHKHVPKLDLNFIELQKKREIANKIIPVNFNLKKATKIEKNVKTIQDIKKSYNNYSKPSLYLELKKKSNK
jgi:hypothetical protein